MNKQNRLNKFINDLGDFFESYYSSQIEDINISKDDGYVILNIIGPEDSFIEITTEDEEILISFGESHWHIDDYNDPCDYEMIYENTMDSVLEILQRKLITFSCWSNGKARGGASFEGYNLDEIKKYSEKYFSSYDELHLKVWGKQKEIIKV